jgi:hypothetical protein
MPPHEQEQERMTDKLMTFEEAAERLGTTPRHMRRLSSSAASPTARSAASSASTLTTWPSTSPPTGSRSRV